MPKVIHINHCGQCPHIGGCWKGEIGDKKVSFLHQCLRNGVENPIDLLETETLEGKEQLQAFGIPKSCPLTEDDATVYVIRSTGIFGGLDKLHGITSNQRSAVDLFDSLRNAL